MKVVLYLTLLSLMLLMTNEIETENYYEFLEGNHIFTSKLYQEMKKTERGNFLISPFSLEVILGLTLSGAKNKTRDEIITSLHFPQNEEDLKYIIQYLVLAIESKHQFITAANKIYVKKNVTVSKNIKEIAATVYKAEVEIIDFSQEEEAARTINKWVKKATLNRVDNLVDSQDLQESFAAVLVNCLHFKGPWFYQFEKQSTIDFYRSSTDVIRVITMSTSGQFYYYESTELKAKFLKVPFRTINASLVIVLPNDKEDLTDLETKSEVFTDKEYTVEFVNLTLPKFEIQSKVSLKKVLQNLGVSTLFSNEADLSGIAGEKGDLKIDDVFQKSVIGINEVGVEETGTSSKIGGKPDVGNTSWIEFIVDHPFIFHLQGVDLILFAGRVVDPSY